MKIGEPRPKKLPMPKSLVGRSLGPRTAFAGGGSHAFRDPATMVAPDQAFGAAMARPQGAGAPGPSTLPTSQG